MQCNLKDNPDRNAWRNGTTINVNPQEKYGQRTHFKNNMVTIHCRGGVFGPYQQELHQLNR